MKKLLIVLLFIPLISFGQNNDINLNVNKKIEITKKKDGKLGEVGLKYLGSGIYTIGRRGSYNYSNSERTLEKLYQKLKTQTITDINDFVNRNNYDYNITIVEKVGTPLNPLVILTFKVTKKDGSEILFKSDAKKRLIELKEYLDLGIITQDDYDKKALSLKKILLGSIMPKEKKQPKELPATKPAKETDSSELLEKNYTITTSKGEVFKSKVYKINKEKGVVDFQKLDGKFIRLKMNMINSIRQGEKEIFKN